MSRHRVTASIAAAFAIGLVVLTSVGGGAFAVPTTDVTESSVDRSIGVGTPAEAVSPSMDAAHPTRSAAQTTVTSSSLGSGHIGVDLVPSGEIDGSLSHVQLPTGGTGGGLSGPSGLVALAGYSRLADDPLSHPLRTELYEAIARTPGAYPSALTARLDTPRSTLRYHLRVLEDAGLVSAAAVDGRHRYVTTEAEEAERALAIVDTGTTAAAIVEQLSRVGSTTVGELAADVDRSSATVSYHLDRLEDAGVVERTRDGQAVQNELTAEASRLVTAVVATPPEAYGAATDD